MNIKEHVREHKETYIVGGTCLLIGALAGITGAIVKEPRTTRHGGVDRPAMESTGSFNSAKSIFGSASNKVVTTIHNGGRGHSGFVTRCVETGELFETQGAAAAAFEVPQGIMSDHLNRGRELAEGYHFERVGILS